MRYNIFVENVSRKTITKKSQFVILLLFFCFFSNSCSSVSSQKSANSNQAQTQVSSDYGKAQTVGKIENKEIEESSGLAASPCQPNVFWTHNDSGSGAKIFALDAKGANLGEFVVSGAENDDWEDIAAYKNENGECFLYIGDIGNNNRGRTEMLIYRVREPKIGAMNEKQASRENSKNETNPFNRRGLSAKVGERSEGRKFAQTETAEAIKFEYPDFRHDAETLMVHPQTGDVYILTKRLSGAAGVYRLGAEFDSKKTNKLEKIADFSVPAVPNGLLTGGDISPDGKRVVVVDYFAAYEIVLPEKAGNFDEIWQAKPSTVLLGERKQGEAIAYGADGNSIFATSEGKKSPVIEVRRK